MRTNIVIFFFLTLIFGISAASCQAVAGSRPAEVNLGTLRLGTTRDTTFLFNVEGTPVVITNVGVDCVCTKVRWDKKPLAPGTRGALGISYKAKEEGLFYKTINVSLSDPKRSFRVIVRGRVVK